MANKRHWWSRWVGRLERQIGEATGDRTVEAKGDVRAVTGQKPDTKTTEEVVDHTRYKHGDTLRERK